ncbi:MAG: trypsin-like serine protease, partial [Anaerolineales bacterium]
YNDVGMIELAEPGFDPGVFGELPDVDSLDQYKTRRGQNDLYFTAVGYGLQASFPDAASWKDEASRTRYVAYPKLLQINVPGFTGDFSLLLSNNHATGGTCFGDSGGPNFLTNTNIVAGITSFGLNSTCAGTGGVFRTDRQNVQDFIHDFMNP